MLYKTATLAFCAQGALGYAPAMPSKMAASRVARVSDIEMAKKSVRSNPKSLMGRPRAASPTRRFAHARPAATLTRSAARVLAGRRPHRG